MSVSWFRYVSLLLEGALHGQDSWASEPIPEESLKR